MFAGPGDARAQPQWIPVVISDYTTVLHIHVSSLT